MGSSWWGMGVEQYRRLVRRYDRKRLRRSGVVQEWEVGRSAGVERAFRVWRAGAARRRRGEQLGGPVWVWDWVVAVRATGVRWARCRWKGEVLAGCLVRLRGREACRRWLGDVGDKARRVGRCGTGRRSGDALTRAMGGCEWFGRWVVK